MQISYAQRLEDYHLDLVFADRKEGFYVDVGGGHPVADNVSFWFYLKGWSGLVVEPQRVLADMYASVRPRDITVCSLVGSRQGEVNFHVVDRLHGFSTTVEGHAKAASGFGATYETRRMPMLTLASLVAQHRVSEIDFLKIDVEGAEADVLAGVDWKNVRPRVVVVEAVAPGSMAETWQGWEPLLLAQGYTFAFFDGLNRFYVASEASELLGRFPSEPAPWDKVQHLWDFGRAAEKPSHPDHALAAQLVAGFLAALPSLDRRLLTELLCGGVSRGKALDAKQMSGLERLLFGAAEYPGETPSIDASADPEQALATLMDSDRFRAALGRIASAYDGGHLMED
jgi:FkbM family methyltransferase